MKDFYYILGINQESNFEQIKQAYRKLSLKFHPDKNDGDIFFEERFKEIQEAYEILSNPKKKSDYDYLLKNASSSNFSKAYYTKEEELRRREEELKRKEEELKRKYQTPEDREKEIQEENRKRRIEEEARIRKDISQLNILLLTKNKDLDNINAQKLKLQNEIKIVEAKIIELNTKLSGTEDNNELKRKSEKFILSNFPQLSKDINQIKNIIPAESNKIFSKIFIQFTKNHSIESDLVNSNQQLVDKILNGSLPIKETERLFKIYKDNKDFIKNLEREISAQFDNVYY